MRFFERLDRPAAVLVVSTWLLLVFGASVRVHGAGLACPDWPLCFGEVIPPIDFQVWLEFGHRVVAGVISLGFLGLGAAVWRRRGALGHAPLVVWGLAAVALAVQIVLGGLTVLELLAEWTVTSHLLSGNTFCMLLLLLTLVLRDRAVPVRRPAVSWVHRGGAVLLALLVPLQLGLGGLVASSHAGLACGTWPGCNGDVWFPTFDGLVGLQVIHRLVAYVLLSVALLQVVLTLGRGRVGRASLVVAAAVLVQAAIGVANVLLRLPVEVTLLHSFGAAGTFLCTAWLNFEAFRAPVRGAVPSGAVAVEAA